MSRFEDDGDYEIPAWMWQTILSRAMASERGQRSLALLEEGLLALPQPRLIEGNLFFKGEACAVGVAIAAKEAKDRGIPIEVVLRERSEGIDWEGEEEAHETAERAESELGWSYSFAWHMAYLNDERFGEATPEERYTELLAYVRRAQGKEPIAS